jgi:predicted site-specific integrase-resolvase
LSVARCKNRCMNLAAWAERNGVARVSAYRWFGAGVLAVAENRAKCARAAAAAKQRGGP